MNDPPPAWAILALGLSLAVLCAMGAAAGTGLLALADWLGRH
ncbi:MAG: hypothetical protein ACM30G_20060 [Micromonosporaceae bacterium]